MLTPSQVARKLTDAGMPISDEAVRQWVANNRIEFTRTPSGRIFIPEDVVDGILDGSTAAADDTERVAS